MLKLDKLATCIQRLIEKRYRLYLEVAILHSPIIAKAASTTNILVNF